MSCHSSFPTTALPSLIVLTVPWSRKESKKDMEIETDRKQVRKAQREQYEQEPTHKKDTVTVTVTLGRVTSIYRGQDVDSIS